MTSSSWNFQYICPIKLCTIPIFCILYIFKANRIMPFCNLFIGRPLYFNFYPNFIPNSNPNPSPNPNWMITLTPFHICIPQFTHCIFILLHFLHFYCIAFIIAFHHNCYACFPISINYALSYQLYHIHWERRGKHQRTDCDD